MNSKIYTPAQFSPKEVEDITGLSTVMQRDWRRRGFIETQTGHAKFGPFEVATILVAKMLADRGIGPSVSKEIAPICGVGLIAYALAEFEFWEGDHVEALSWATLPPPKPLDAEIIALMEKKGIDPTPRNPNWGIRSAWLTRQILQLSDVGVKPAPFFAWYPNGSHEWAVKPQDFFQESRLDEKYHGAVIILDLEAIGGDFGERCKRPIMHVEFERDDDGKIIPPMEYGAPVKIRYKEAE